MTETIGLTVWKEQAKKIKEMLGLVMVGDIAYVTTKIKFEVLPAEGRRKIGISFKIEKKVKK